jgi:hypothetical protein
MWKEAWDVTKQLSQQRIIQPKTLVKPKLRNPSLKERREKEGRGIMAEPGVCFSRSQLSLPFPTL